MLKNYKRIYVRQLLSIRMIIMRVNFSKWGVPTLLRRMIRMMSQWRLGYSSGRSSDRLCGRRWNILRTGGGVVGGLSPSTTGEEASIPRKLLVVRVGLEVLEESLLENGICSSRNKAERCQKELKVSLVL